MTLIDLLHQHALTHPGRTAYGLPDGRTLTYGDWHEASTIAAGHVAGMIEREDRVALVFSLSDWNDYAIAYMAVMKAGGVCVPMGGDRPRARLHDMLQLLDTRLAIGSRPIDAGSVRQVTIGELMRAGPELAQRPPRSSEPGEVLFTSGTTGPPRPVVATHANLAHYVSARRRSPAAPATICHATAFASNAAQTMLIQPLGPGGKTVITASPLDEATLESVIRRFGVTELTATPTTLIQLADSSEKDFSSIGRVNVVAAPVTSANLHRIAARFQNATIVNVYTSTEAWPARTTLHLGDGPEGSVGCPRGGSRVAILADDDTPVDPGEIGDVALLLPPDVSPRSDLITQGTVGNLVKTGDVGFVDADGYLYIVDRESDVINAGGAKIYSLEIEAAIAELPAVADVAVVGLGHETLGEYAVAAVVLDRPVGTVELRREVKARLGASKTPHEMVALPDLPRNAGGKIDKRALRELLARRSPAITSDRPAETAGLLARVTRAWEQALGMDDFDPDDNFFACGGNSLLAMRIVTALSEELGVDLPAEAYFDWTTITEMTDVIQASLDHGEDRTHG